MLKKIVDIGLIYLIIFLLPVCILFTLLTKIFKEIFNKIIMYFLVIILTIFFEVQLIFYNLFSVPFSFSTIGLADQALDFVNIVKDAIKSNDASIIKNVLYAWLTNKKDMIRGRILGEVLEQEDIPDCLFLLPLLLLIILNIFKLINYKKYSKASKISLALMFIVSYGVTFMYLLPNKNENNSEYKLYFKIDDANSIIDKFGLINYMKIDIKRQIMGYENELNIEKPKKKDKKKKEEPKEIVYKDNVLELEFLDNDNKQINTLNEYFKNSEASKQNEYTGMFKGKNLIFILAEGYNEVALDKDRTPTLYKMVHEGFNFTNFYSPVFLSTTGGEFQATTGLIPTQETLKLWKQKQPTVAFALGNAFNKIGYRAQSFHNWTYTYYKRNITMKTLGFDNYTGIGNGLEKKIRSNWLPSDIDMMNATTSDYLGQEGNFVTYYVTVSGHSPYNSSDNIAKQYLDQIDSSLPSQARYYLASQMELDKALETLISKLEESGELDNTVIAMVGDHYPYTLTLDEMNSIASYTKDEIVEINRSNFFLWSSSMEKEITVDKVGSQIDVLPTLLNLFGIEYDSRLIVGKDILSDYPGIAIFSNRSWVSDYGTYFAGGRFIIKEGKVLENQEEYIREMNNRVANGFSISKMIMDSKYYDYIIKE